jgi:hypothetical protein
VRSFIYNSQKRLSKPRELLLMADEFNKIADRLTTLSSSDYVVARLKHFAHTLGLTHTPSGLLQLPPLSSPRTPRARAVAAAPRAAGGVDSSALTQSIDEAGADWEVRQRTLLDLITRYKGIIARAEQEIAAHNAQKGKEDV